MMGPWEYGELRTTVSLNCSGLSFFHRGWVERPEGMNTWPKDPIADNDGAWPGLHIGHL